MTIKSRLFASVAAPFVSLPLVLQPAGAMPNVALDTNAANAKIILVQEQILPPEGQPEGQVEPEAEQPRPEPEAPPVQEPPQEAPAPEPEAPPAPREEPAAVPEPQAAPEPEAPRQEEPAPAPAPEAEQPAPPPAVEPEPVPQPEQPAAPDAAPAPERGSEVEPAPRRPERQGEQRSRGERPMNRPVEQPVEQPADRSATPPAAPVPGEIPPPASAPGGAEAPASVAPPPAQAPAEQQALPAAPTTPDDIRRAEEIARDPSLAPAGAAAVLPVENGAAILDSAKEEAPRSRGGRDGERPRGERPDRGPRPETKPAQQPTEIFIPRTDAEAQAAPSNAAPLPPVRMEAVTAERGERIDRRPDFDRVRGWDDAPRSGRDRDRREDGRVIFNIDNRTVIRHDDSRRFYEDEDSQPYYERLGGGRTREVIERGDGTQVVTIRNRYGEILQRSRIARDGREYVLYYAPEPEERGDDYVWHDPGYDLPPMRLTVPLDDYIIDTSSDRDRDYYGFLEKPPVERVERVYSLDEVRYSARIRDKVRRIDLDTINFATGSAEVSMNQARSLRKVAEAINQVLEKNPAETFLIEGHTDAVGSDESNLILSDERAESVASVLSDAFGIPPENMATQGYGERYLKVRTQAASQENRRVTIRRITPLVRPVAANNN